MMSVPYPSPEETAKTFAWFKDLFGELYALESNRFQREFDQAKTTAEFYAVIHAFDYAGNSKELRDTGDDRIHTVLNEMRDQKRKLDQFFQIKLLPGSLAQQKEWNQSILKDAGGKYVVRDDNTIQIGLLDAKLNGSTLHVGRVWHHVCNFGGSEQNFDLKLDAAQTEELKTRLALANNFKFEW